MAMFEAQRTFEVTDIRHSAEYRLEYIVGRVLEPLEHVKVVLKYPGK